MIDLSQDDHPHRNVLVCGGMSRLDRDGAGSAHLESFTV
jgi:hypothetical protein